MKVHRLYKEIHTASTMETINPFFDMDNFFSRKYHNTTSKYNSFFNAKENIKSCEKDIDQNFIENYDKILSFYKTSKDASAYNSRLDKAIKKATKNIMKHSIMEEKILVYEDVWL